MFWTCCQTDTSSSTPPPPSSDSGSPFSGSVGYDECANCADDVFPLRYDLEWTPQGGSHACQPYFDNGFTVTWGNNCLWSTNDKQRDTNIWSPFALCNESSIHFTTATLQIGATSIAVNLVLVSGGFSVNIASYEKTIVTPVNCLDTWQLTRTRYDAGLINLPSFITVRPSP